LPVLTDPFKEGSLHEVISREIVQENRNNYADKFKLTWSI